MCQTIETLSTLGHPQPNQVIRPSFPIVLHFQLSRSAPYFTFHKLKTFETPWMHAT